MQQLQNTSLLPYNTFGIDVTAEHFADVNSLADLQDLPAGLSLHILGGGSNVLLTGNVHGLVLHNKLKGINVVREEEDHVWLSVASGEIWHNFVLHSIEMGLGGIENLALIPGTVGAAPIQNIGAYGTEVKQTIEEVSFWHLAERRLITLSNTDCRFGYRDSIFKTQLRGQFFITSVTFRLNKKPVLNTSYGAIEQELKDMGITHPTVKDVAQAVINIRTSKLPDPKVTGNAGSFFKNPTIPLAHYKVLQAAYPTIPHYPVSDDTVKVPAAWLIEQCGWKGHRAGDAGVHTKQALVLVNYGHASGNEVWQLSGNIIDSVADRFNISLEREVQVW